MKQSEEREQPSCGQGGCVSLGSTPTKLDLFGASVTPKNDTITLTYMRVNKLNGQIVRYGEEGNFQFVLFPEHEHKAAITFCRLMNGMLFAFDATQDVEVSSVKTDNYPFV